MQTRGIRYKPQQRCVAVVEFQELAGLSEKKKKIQRAYITVVKYLGYKAGEGFGEETV